MSTWTTNSSGDSMFIELIAIRANDTTYKFCVSLDAIERFAPNTDERYTNMWCKNDGASYTTINLTYDELKQALKDQEFLRWEVIKS
jgi:hypothetical protein